MKKNFLLVAAVLMGSVSAYGVVRFHDDAKENPAAIVSGALNSGFYGKFSRWYLSRFIYPEKLDNNALNAVILECLPWVRECEETAKILIGKGLDPQTLQPRPQEVLLLLQSKGGR